MRKAFVILFSVLISCSFMTSCFDSNQTGTTRSSEEQEFYDNFYVQGRTVEIDYRSDPERVIKNLDYYANHPYVSEEDKAKFELAKEVYTEFPYSIKITYSVNSNSFEDKEVSFNYFTFSYGTVGISEECNLEIKNRIGVLWLNDEIDKMYDFEEHVNATASICQYCNKFPTVEEFKKFSVDYEWLKLVDGFDYEKSVPGDERSAANYYILDLLKENYLKYNPKLLENADEAKLFGWPNYDNIDQLFKIYKKYGNAAFGKEVDGVFVIDNYEEMYGELDQAIMIEFSLTETDFR